MLDSRAQVHPDAVALIDGPNRMTYAELTVAVDQAADHLVTHGVRPNQLVGLLADRDLDTLVWLLGILAAGAAYVPLDPSHPQDRVRYIADDAGLSIVVGDRTTAARVGLIDRHLINPGDRRGPSSPRRPAGFEPTPDSTAYVLYTSGSTGRPKGCVVTHTNVLALVASMRDLYGLASQDRWALFASLCFDVSVMELWCTFESGATAVVVPWSCVMSSEDLVDLLRVQEITILFQVPSILRYTVDALADEGYPRLHLTSLLVGGEGVNRSVVLEYLDHAGPNPPRVINVYGPTESTVMATGKLLDRSALEGPVGSPIGRALPHLRAHVLNPELRTVNVGETGELWLSGTGLARGYWNRPELTAERFVVLPLGPDAAPLRCYRTGDLVRLLDNGELDYLGRNDAQVKFRGSRVELPEIEAALDLHPLVHASAVSIVETAVGPELVACVTPATRGVDIPIVAVRQMLQKSLPGHMVPRRIVQVGRLPLTTSGKLDRAAVGGLVIDAE
ncbi:amino acid adenylation domain-containing protein [Nocardioides zeae]|uniref:amino acid adenylation domain-containing protein n=1 Tax=Nocardioides zeae TaxID=1457234 RepID=UPI0027D8E4DA|nr:amino acid adenylation domain-containing protein [Nocardioides zeae]